MIIAYVPPIGFTWTAIAIGLIGNIIALVLTFKDPAPLAIRMRYTIIPILGFMTYWFICNTLQLFGMIDRPEYLELIAPVAPVAFLFVWPAVAWSYIAGVLPRLEKDKKDRPWKSHK